MNTQPQRLAFNLVLVAGGLVVGGLGVLAVGRHQPATDTAAAPMAAGTSASSAASQRKVLYWYDPMVPGQKFDKPGKSPFMDMQLVPRYADESDPGARGDASQGPTLAISTQAQQALGLRLATVEQRAIGASIEAVGTVLLNERDIAIVQSRTAGFVERVYARAPGDVIAAGAPLVDVLNPDWLGAQQEYLAVKATGDAGLTRAARQRLVLLGMPMNLIDHADKTGQPTALQTITAPTGGVITELMVRAGMTLAPGMTLARINGLGQVWLEAALPEALAATVMPGQVVEARFPALPGEVVKGKVAAVLPEANRETRTLRLRIELPNPGQRLRAGLFAQVRLRGAPRQALVVPAEAVIRTGQRALVYVSEQAGRFRPVEVEIGEQVGEQIVVRSGLVAGQQVVASGQFLIDSEASLQGVMARSAAPVASAASALAPAAAAPMVYQAKGKVDEIEGDVITLQHEPVPALKWPAMTMPFNLSDATLAKGLKPGQAVEFSFSKGDAGFVITHIKPLGAAPAAAAASGAPR
ncbi:MAG: efflux RND transporter periplasmic adaptor subunit [Ideonella sp.]|nr:efflux RND transporter periplasmic adaptor subunit [Ideonella sp.]